MVSPNSLGPRIEDLGGAFAVRPSRGSNWKNLYAEKPKAINEVDVRIAAMIVRSYATRVLSMASRVAVSRTKESLGEVGSIGLGVAMG